MSDQAQSDRSCSRCDGVGQRVKKITRRRDGSVSSVTYDGRDCSACQGTGLKAMEVKS